MNLLLDILIALVLALIATGYLAVGVWLLRTAWVGVFGP